MCARRDTAPELGINLNLYHEYIYIKFLYLLRIYFLNIFVFHFVLIGVKT